MGTEQSNLDLVFIELSNLGKLIKEQISNFQEVANRVDALLATSAEFHPVLQIPISELPIPAKVRNVLRRRSIPNLKEIVNKDRKLVNVPGLGRQGKAVIVRLLKDKGFPINTDK